MKFSRIFVLCFALFLILTCYGQNGDKYKTYVVRKKATVETIAFLNDVTPQQILLANPTINPSAKLKPGTEVKIPVVENHSDNIKPVASSPSANKSSAETEIQKSATKLSSSKQPSAKQKSTQASLKQEVSSVSSKQPDVKQATVKESVQSSVSSQIGKQVTVHESSKHVVASVVKQSDTDESVKPAMLSENSEPLIDFNQSKKEIVITALLPFENSSLSQSMAELYSGMVVAASDASENNDNEVSVKAFSTENLSEDYLDKILSSADAIIGPVDKAHFEIVASWAKEHHKPIISPLTAFDVPNNNYVISMAPLQSYKNEPIVEFLSGDKNIVLIQHAQYPNKQLETEFLKIAPHAKQFRYVREAVTPKMLAPLMDTQKDNIVLVPTDHQGAIEDVLSKITAINSPIKTCNIYIIGSPQWLNLSNFSQVLLFRGNVSCVSSYFYNRHDKVVSTLFEDYINAFERIPGRFAMRGYDIVDIIANSLSRWGDKMLVEIDDTDFTPLQTSYHFVRNASNGNLQNTKWILVSYSDDYSVNIH